jgi:hypothetical protein
MYIRKHVPVFRMICGVHFRHTFNEKFSKFLLSLFHCVCRQLYGHFNPVSVSIFFITQFHFEEVCWFQFFIQNKQFLLCVYKSCYIIQNCQFVWRLVFEFWIQKLAGKNKLQFLSMYLLTQPLSRIEQCNTVH